MDDVNRDTPRREMHWWQDWKWIASVAALALVVAFSIFVFSTVRTGNTVENQEPVITQLKSIAEQNKATNEANKATLDRLDRNQAGIDELVAFVHEVQAQQAAAGQSEIVNNIITILCSSSDPVRIEACARLGYDGIGGG